MCKKEYRKDYRVKHFLAYFTLNCHKVSLVTQFSTVYVLFLILTIL